MKKSPLKKKTGLKQKTSLRRRTRLSGRSEKTQLKYEKRRELVATLLGSRPWCEACQIYHTRDHGTAGVARARPAHHLHEIVNRSQGGDILDESIIVVVCAPCHRRIDHDPDEAELLGLHLRGADHTPQNVKESRLVRESWADGVPMIPHYREARES